MTENGYVFRRLLRIFSFSIPLAYIVYMYIIDTTLIELILILVVLVILLIPWYTMNLCDTYERNERKAIFLMERYYAAASAVRDDKLYSPASCANSKRLSSMIKAMENFVEHQQQYNRLQKLLKANSIKSKYKELCEDYDISVNLLKLTILVDFKVDSEKFNKILKENVEEVVERQRVLDESINDINKKLNALKTSDIANNAISKDIPFTKFVSSIKDIVEVDKVSNAEDLIYTNKIVERLIDRVAATKSIFSVFHDNDQLLDKLSYDNLRRLSLILKEMTDFAEEVMKYSKLKKIFKTSLIKLKYKKLCEDYDSKINTLNLALMVNFKADSENFNKDLKKEIEEIFKFQGILGESVTEMNKKIIDMVIYNTQNWLKNAIKEGLIKEVEWNKLTEISEVGTGHFGSVSKARWSKTNDYVVFKKLIHSNEIQHEIRMQHKADTCENVIRFLGVIREPSNDNYRIVMEYADGGDLQVYLGKNFSSFDWNKKYQLAFDITNGLYYLHKENIIHRDLHAKNIVIQKGRAKITDFGYAKKVETQIDQRNGIYGSISYTAPELLKYNLPLHSKKTDIYSLGVLFWELSSGYPPFKNEDYDSNALIGLLIEGLRELMIPDTPECYYILYIACWDGDSKKRPKIDDVYDILKNMTPFSNDGGPSTTTRSEFTTIKIEDNEVCEYSDTTKFNFLDKENI